MKLYDLRIKSLEDLNILLISLLREKFNLNMQLSDKQIKQSHLLKKVRRNIIWIKTLITQKKNKDIL